MLASPRFAALVAEHVGSMPPAFRAAEEDAIIRILLTSGTMTVWRSTVYGSLIFAPLPPSAEWECIHVERVTTDHTDPEPPMFLPSIID